MSITQPGIAKWTLQQLEEGWERVEHDAVDMRGYWRGRVAELEAAEKAEPSACGPDEPQHYGLREWDSDAFKAICKGLLAAELACVAHVKIAPLLERLDALENRVTIAIDSANQDRRISDVRLERIEAWATEFAEWGDDHGHSSTLTRHRAMSKAPRILHLPPPTKGKTCTKPAEPS